VVQALDLIDAGARVVAWIVLGGDRPQRVARLHHHRLGGGAAWATRLRASITASAATRTRAQR